MPASELLWYDPVEISAAGNVGGLVHYYNEWAQVIFATAADEMRTRTAFVDGGNFPGAVWSSEKDIDGGQSIIDIRIDHPSFGQVFAAWINDGSLVCALYNYAADIADIVENLEITEKVDNTIRSLGMTVKNVAADMFQDDASLFAPGAAVEVDFTSGSSEEWYPMGRYFLDQCPFDPFAASHSLQGRSRAGRLLNDPTFDLYGISTGAKFTGTPAEIVAAILQRYSDGEIAASEILAQPGGASTSVTFEPDQQILDGLDGWLSGKDTAEEEAHDTLAYGASGSEVRLAQTLINKALPASYTKLVVDGIFGTKTKAAVKYVQGIKGLTVNGTVDGPTWAALLARPVNWRIYELYDGRFVAGQPAFIAGYRPIGRYTFTRGQDVLTRSIERSADGCYKRVGVRYKSGEADAYVFASVDKWPSWAIPSHKTYYEDAPDGATAAQAQTQANNRAVELQYVGVQEQVYGPIRPELLVGDIAQIYNEDETATVTGLITEIRHSLGERGFMTTFVTDSGGAIMDDTLDEVTVEVSAMSAVWGGANRKRRMRDLIEVISKKRGRFPIVLE